MSSRDKGKIRLFLNGSKFPKAGLLGHCNTYARVTLIPESFLRSRTGHQELGITEVVQENTAPNWAKIYTIDYDAKDGGIYFLVEVLSCKRNKPNDNDAVIGSVKFSLEELFYMDGRAKAKRMGKKGFIHARVEFFGHANNDDENGGTATNGNSNDDMTTNIAFQMRALFLDTGKQSPDTYFEIFRHAEVSKQLIYRSNVVVDCAFPEWDILHMDLDTFCQNDLDNSLLFLVYRRKKSNSKSILIGSLETSVRVLLNKFSESMRQENNTQNSKKITLCTFTIRKTKKGDIEDTGTVEIIACDLRSPNGIVRDEYAMYHYNSTNNVPANNSQQNISQNLNNTQTITKISDTIEPRPLFEEYIDSGNKLDMYVAIDFTSTNGDPRVPGTLHYREDTSLNHYEESMIKIGNFIANLCRERKFPVWGFGARFEGIVRHIFQCSSSAEVNDITGVLEAYRYVLEAGLTMSNPRLLVNILNKAASKALENYEEFQSYGILFLLTSGVAADMPSVITTLKSISPLPLSIIIVGIGEAADFSIYEQILDIQQNDSEWRNNVTFVSFNNLRYEPNAIIDQAVRDFPEQFVDYFVGENIPPKSRQAS